MGLVAACWLLVGLAVDKPLITSFAMVPVVLLAWAAVAARVARQRLVDGGLDVSVAPPKARPGQHSDGPGEIRLNVQRAISLDLSVSARPGLRLMNIALTPTSTSCLRLSVVGLDSPAPSLSVVGRRVGYRWLHGFMVSAHAGLGLFTVRAFVPCPQPFAVLPRRFALGARPDFGPTRSAPRDHGGAINRRRRGLGMELRELREFYPGDPFKHIAWRASARQGKLVSREFESDLTLSTWIVLDVSPSMFWGQAGAARVDFAVEAAYELATMILGSGDRAGLIIHDHAVRLMVPLGSGRGHLHRVLRALLEVPHLIHEDRTELTDRELVERVADYFSGIWGQHFALPDGLVHSGSPRLSPFDEGRLLRAVSERLQGRVGHGNTTKYMTQEAMGRRRPLVPYESYAVDAQRSSLRAFCRAFGLDLPMDPTPRPSGQVHGIEAALKRIIAGGRGAHTVLCISDFYTAEDDAALRRIALVARRHRHPLLIFCPDDPGFDEVDGGGGDTVNPAPSLTATLVEVERLRVRINLRRAQGILRPAGARFVSVRVGESLGSVLARLRRVA